MEEGLSTSRKEEHQESTNLQTCRSPGQVEVRELDIQGYHRMLEMLSVHCEIQENRKDQLFVRSSSFISILQRPKSHNAICPE